MIRDEISDDLPTPSSPTNVTRTSRTTIQSQSTNRNEMLSRTRGRAAKLGFSWSRLLFAAQDASSPFAVSRSLPLPSTFSFPSPMPIFSHNLLPYGGPYKGKEHPPWASDPPPWPLNRPCPSVGTLDLELPTKVESFGTALLAGTQTPALLVRSSPVLARRMTSPCDRTTS